MTSSDHGTNFLSKLIQEICQLMVAKKVNTSGYHPQMDEFEKFNSTLVNMLSKVVQEHARDWGR